MYLLQRAFYHRGHRDRTENTEKRKDNFYCKEILTAEGTEVAKKKKICPPINTNKRFNYCKELFITEKTEVAKKEKICPQIDTNKRFNYCKELFTTEGTEIERRTQRREKIIFIAKNF